MDVVIIFNGLGNQMSQYALYLQKKQLAKSSRYIFSKKSAGNHNGYELNTHFGIEYHDTFTNKLLFLLFRMVGYKKYPLLSKPIVRLLNLLGVEIIHENENYDFDPKHLQPSLGIKFYEGGWHSEKYFINIKEEILQTFQFKADRLGFENMQVLEKIHSVNSVSVHVRRGDFLDADNYKKFGSICTLNYFLCAIKKMNTIVEKPHFFFFTNDPEWVAENFISPNYTLININQFGNSWKDMYLISNCQCHIDSNGSFSWWASWLNQQSNKQVIVPKYFIAGHYSKDVYPESWIRLTDY
jgi:hypothetical protein